MQLEYIYIYIYIGSLANIKQVGDSQIQKKKNWLYQTIKVALIKLNSNGEGTYKRRSDDCN
jgi:hypothetical protein